ncbi:PITH domain-containing protein, partial [Peziza echinospora]
MSHHCHDEHSHSHSHGGGADEAPHTHDDDISPAQQSSLYEHIDHDKITTLNELIPHSGRAIVKKPWSARLSPPDPTLTSDSDDQLLIYIPFTSLVKLHSLVLRTSNTDAAPKTVKLYANRDDLDFEEVEHASPTQVLETPMTGEVFEVPLRRALWNGTRSVTVFVEEGWGAEAVEIGYLGFRGDWMRVGGPPVGIMYEAAANPNDHKLKNGETW